MESVARGWADAIFDNGDRVYRCLLRPTIFPKLYDGLLTGGFEELNTQVEECFV